MDRQLVEQAIQNRKILEFTYHGFLRVVEPHILGVNRGVTQVLAYQIGGRSKSGGIPEWRRFDLHEIKNLVITNQTFSGPRDTWTGRDSDWDYKIAFIH